MLALPFESIEPQGGNPGLLNRLEYIGQKPDSEKEIRGAHFKPTEKQSLVLLPVLVVILGLECICRDCKISERRHVIRTSNRRAPLYQR